MRKPSAEFIAPLGGNGDVIQNDTYNEFESDSTTVDSEHNLDSKSKEDDLKRSLADLPHPTTSENKDIPLTPEIPTPATEDQNKGPIPSFKEWAQKQMEQEQAEKKSEEVPSSQKKNITNGSKTIANKIHAKNYASLECGAKIIASNSEAQHTGALLTSTKDEYMLSPCTNRIWFVVELCEAIQAEKIELANFELFSSSPKNFTVAVSNRFPTRDWSNVGRFIAADQRNIQSFNLHPHLFGKFVRVDIYSHYNSEHFCPVSLFRVYGTSEFEAFETENRDHDDVGDDLDDEDTNVAQNKEKTDILTSAGNVVMSIVKKAAEVLVKPSSANKTEDKDEITKENVYACWTLTEPFHCKICRTEFVESVNYLLKSNYLDLSRLLKNEVLKKDMNSSNVCANYFDIELDSCIVKSNQSYRETFLLKTISVKHLAALCHLMTNGMNSSFASIEKKDENNASNNLTIGTESTKEIFEFPNNEEKIISPKLPEIPSVKPSETYVPENKKSTVSKEAIPDSDVNIFNINPEEKDADNILSKTTSLVPPLSLEREEPSETATTEDFSKEVDETVQTTLIPPTIEESAININPTPTLTTTALKSDEKTKEELTDTWESLDKFMSENQNQPKTNNIAGSGPQSESVFIRLSNRIKVIASISYLLRYLLGNLFFYFIETLNKKN